MQLSIFSSEERPVNHSASRGSGLDWMIRGGTSASLILQSLTAIAPNGSFGRMFRGYCRPGKDGILEPSSGVWANSGMGSPTECLMLNTFEWTGLSELSHSDAGVCSLSDILETGDALHRYFLSKKACCQILLRAEQQNKELPPEVKAVLGNQSIP